MLIEYVFLTVIFYQTLKKNPTDDNLVYLQGLHLYRSHRGQGQGQAVCSRGYCVVNVHCDDISYQGAERAKSRRRKECEQECGEVRRQRRGC